MLALICGTGHLPRAVAGAQDAPPLVCVLEGFAPEGLAADVTFRLERLGSFLQELKARGVRDLCLCGAITRPEIDPSLIDAATAPLVPRLMAAMEQGDDGALRAVIGILEEEGFVLHGATVLAPDILPEAGCPTVARPKRETRADFEIAHSALAEMAARDEGQACIVRLGQVEAMEQQDGTDAMLRAYTARGVSGGVLVKAPKPGQERRADLPTIGPETASRAIEAGLDGVVIAAGSVIVLEPEEVVQRLDTAGAFLWVVPT